MSGFSSNHLLVLDGNSGSFRRLAGDLGEVIALLHGGVRPDPETLSRLCLSLRGIQAFLIEEADEQAGREAVSKAFCEDAALRAAVAALVRPVHVAMPVTEVSDA